ncbi:hypothetical protein [Pelomonas sp. KK5]|uniref:hypothetical protein n=1 Tax=Pelomonas sp. KK5 TaxID=1855730 RepID=UPI00097CBB1E|nr:hypothetical protein [Pelomonas sp. KK5]
MPSFFFAFFYRFALLALVLLALSGRAAAVEPLTTYDIVLLQPDEVMKARVPSVDAFGEYIRALQRQARLPGPGAAGSGFVVVGIRPGGKSRFWLDFDAPAPSAALGELLVKQLQAVPAPPVQGGAVVFALKVGLWGGKPSARVAPAPAAWKAAAAKAGHPIDPGELAELTWNE